MTSGVPNQFFATNKENQLLMMNNNAFNQKRNSMNEAERRRQLRKAPVQLDSQQRPIRSANASPSAAHQFVANQLGQANYNQLTNADRLAVGNLLTQNQQRPGTSGGILTQPRTQKSSPNTSKGAIRPKTTAKVEPYSQTTSATTASTTNNNRGTPAQTKSLGEESIQRILKKGGVKKPQSRPSSGNKKKQSPDADQ